MQRNSVIIIIAIALAVIVIVPSSYLLLSNHQSTPLPAVSSDNRTGNFMWSGNFTGHTNTLLPLNLTYSNVSTNFSQVNSGPSYLNTSLLSSGRGAPSLLCFNFEYHVSGSLRLTALPPLVAISGSPLSDFYTFHELGGNASAPMVNVSKQLCQWAPPYQELSLLNESNCTGNGRYNFQLTAYIYEVRVPCSGLENPFNLYLNASLIGLSSPVYTRTNLTINNTGFKAG